jgi:hypothetical protein
MTAAPKRKAPSKRAAPAEPRVRITEKVGKPARVAKAPAPLRTPIDTPQIGPPSWSTRRVKLRSLMPWPRNPRKINEAQSARLVNSFEEFGQVELIALGPNGEVYNGHQRLKVLSAKYGPDYELEARVCSRTLTETEREKLTIYLHKGAAGEFDLEQLLKDWDPIKLNDWGMPDLNIPDVAEDEWKEMPEFDGTPRSFARVTVLFTCADDVAKFAELVGQPVTVETVSLWFPAKERTDLSTEQWVGDEPEAPT